MNKILLLLVCFLFLFITGCGIGKKCNCQTDLANISKNDSIIEKSKSIKIWEAFDIPLLHHVNKEVYRLLVFPSWAEEEASLYTVEKSGNEMQINVRYYNAREGGIRYDSLDRKLNYQLNKKNWDDFELLVEENCFWTTSVTDERMIMDGTSLILEAKKNKPDICTDRYYHVIARKRGYGSKEFSEICERLMQLAVEKENKE